MANSKPFSLVRRLTGTVLILLLILLVIQIAGTLWGRYVVTQELYSSTQNNVNYLRDTFEENVQQIQREMTSQLFYQDSPQLITFYTQLRKGAFSTNAHYHWELNQLKLELNVAQRMNAILDGMDIYFPKLGRALSVRQGAISQNAVAFEDIRSVYAAFRETDFRLTRIDDAFFIPCHYPVSGVSAESGHILIALRLDDGKIQEILSSFNTFSGKNALLYHYPSDTCVTSSGSVQLQPQELQALLTSHAKTDTQGQITLDGVRYLAMCAYSETLDCSFVQLIPARQISSVPNILLGSTLLFFVAMLTVILLILRSFHKYVNRPVQSLIAAFDKTGQGEFAARVAPQGSREFAALANGFNQMTDKLEELIDTNYRQTITLQQAQLKTLQAQINPHFLYNSFFFLRSMLEDEETEVAAEFAGYLGKYFRYITKADGNLLTLEKEYDHAITYLKIQLMRFGQTIRAEVPDIPEALRSKTVPKLFLQPVLENCIEHGMGGSADQARIRISFRIREGSAFVVVENSGDGIAPEMLHALQQKLNCSTDDSQTSGLTNVHRRLKLFFGDAGGVELAASDLGGLKVILKIGEAET